MGKYPQYEATFFMVLLTLFVLALLKFKVGNAYSAFSNFTLVRIYTRPLFLSLVYCVFIHFDVIYCEAYYHTVVIGGGAMMLYNLLEQI